MNQATKILVGLLVLCLGATLGGQILDLHAGGNANLYLTPAAGTFAIGQQFSVAVRMSTAGIDVNAAEGQVSFDPTKLQVVGISKAGTIFPLWVQEPTFSNTNGTIRFGGGLPNPGFNGSNAHIITITFRPRASTGTDMTAVVISSGSILANDGQGTNVIGSLGRGEYTISGGPAPSTTPTPVGGLSAPSITSDTHSDQTAWYNASTAHFSWPVPSGVTQVRLALTARPTSAPHVSYIPAINEKTIDDIADGTWYFNAQFIATGRSSPVTSFRFNIDTLPPLPFTVTRVDSSDLTDPTPEILFGTTDATSGVDHYELQIGSGAWVRVLVDAAGKPYALPLQMPGTRVVTVRAVDQAGNTTASSLTLTVVPIVSPVITDFTPQVSGDSPVILSGTAAPGSTVLIYAVPANSSPTALRSPDDDTNRVGQAQADAQGRWSASVLMPEAGEYAFYAYAKDQRGALSMPSNTVTVRVIFGAFGRGVRFIEHLMSGILSPYGGWFWMSLLFYLILAWLLFLGLRWMWLWFLIFWRRQKEDRRIPNKLALLYQDIEDELALLDKAEKSRPLYPEEQYLRNKLLQYRKTVKFLVSDTHSRLAKKK